jgi:hypothetical protein
MPVQRGSCIQLSCKRCSGVCLTMKPPSNVDKIAGQKELFFSAAPIRCARNLHWQTKSSDSDELDKKVLSFSTLWQEPGLINSEILVCPASFSRNLSTTW